MGRNFLWLRPASLKDLDIVRRFGSLWMYGTFDILGSYISNILEAIMGVVVAFNYQQFIQLFPQFAYITSTQMQEFFNLATQFVRNDGGGPVSDPSTQTNLLNLVTAHLLQLFGPKNDGTNQPNRDANVVGRITNASEGSVSVATDMAAGQNQNASFWMQTQYGAAFWAASAPYRTFRYIPGHPKPVNPWPIFGSFGPGSWWRPN